MLDDDLERRRRNPGSVPRRDLVAALREAGYELARTHGKHEVWKRGPIKIAVPRTLKAPGTVRGIVEVMVAARRYDRGEP